MAINYPINFKVDNSGLKKATGSLKKFGKQAAQIGAAAGAAIGGAAAFSIQKFADFDSALNKSISIMGDVSDTLRNEMGEAAKEVAKTTTFSAEEAAEAYFFLASAGLDAEQQIAAMPQVAKFAQAGMFDMALATDLATDAQSALGLTVTDAQENLENLTRVTDVFVKANTLANTSVEQLATAFTSKAGTALKTVGKDVEEGAAALAVFADQGIKGQRAGTLLTNTIFGLTEQAQNNADAFAQLNIEVFDGEGNLKNFSEISAEVTTAFEGMSTEAKLAAIDQLGFTKQAREGILALEGQSEQLSIYEGELREAGGTAESVADNQLETFNARMELLKSNVEVAAIEIGEELIPYVEDFVDGLLPLIDRHLPTVIGFFEDLAGNVDSVASELQVHIDDLLPEYKQLFTDLEEPLENVNDFLTTLGTEVLTRVKELLESQAFQDALKNVGEQIGELATQSERFIKSEVGQAMMDFASSSVIFAVDLLGNSIGAVADKLEQLNDAIAEFEKGNILGGLGDLANFFGLNPRNPFQRVRDLNNNFIGQSGAGNERYGPTTDVPNFAMGGIVKARSGGLIGRIGEAGRDEAVIPLDKAGNLTAGGGNNITINVNAGMGTDGQRVGQQIVDEILKFERNSGRVFARA